MAKKNKINKAVSGITPTFTADRVFVYLVGGAATLAGLYVIGTFVKRGLNKDENTKPLLNKSKVQDVNNSSGAIDYQEGLSQSEMIKVQQFLMSKGYNLGNSVATGIAGPKTYTAVRSVGFSNARDLLNNI